MCIGQSDTVHFDSLIFKTSCDKVLFLSNSKVYLHNPYFLSRLVNYHRRCVLTVSEYYYHSKDIFDYSIDLKCEFPESEVLKYDKYKKLIDTTFGEITYYKQKDTYKQIKNIENLFLSEEFGYGCQSNSTLKINSFKKLNINDFKINELIFNDASKIYSKVYEELLKNQSLNVEKINIRESFDSLPDYLSSFKNLKSLELEIFQGDGLGVLSLWNNYSTIYLTTVLSNLSDELRFFKVDFVGGNLFIPESSIQRFKNLEALHLNLQSNSASPFASIPVSLLLSQKFKFFNASIEYFKSIDYKYPTPIYDKDYCNLCYERTCQRLDYANKLDTIIFRDLEQKIYATGKVNDDNLAEGKWLFYHKNGTIAEERHYKQGVEVGEWLMYDEQGNRVGHYEFKKDTTICTYYKSTGGLGYQYILFNNYTDGIYKRWNDVGVLVTEKRYKSSRYE